MRNAPVSPKCAALPEKRNYSSCRLIRLDCYIYISYMHCQGPIVVKGVVTGDDARRAIDEGAAAPPITHVP